MKKYIIVLITFWLSPLLLLGQNGDSVLIISDLKQIEATLKIVTLIEKYQLDSISESINFSKKTLLLIENQEKYIDSIRFWRKDQSVSLNKLFQINTSLNDLYKTLNRNDNDKLIFIQNYEQINGEILISKSIVKEVKLSDPPPIDFVSPPKNKKGLKNKKKSKN